MAHRKRDRAPPRSRVLARGLLVLQVMASDSNSGIVAIVAILMIVLVGGFVAWQAGVFNSGGGGHSTTHKIDVNVK